MIKPYLELFRLIRHFGSLKFDELMIFGLQLVDYHQFDNIVLKIENFRIAKAQYQGNSKKFKSEYLDAELRQIYGCDIVSGKTKTRQTDDASIEKFLKTKASNLRDYADACVRYIRVTGLVNISHIGKSISIVPEKIQEVDYFLQHTDREPCFIDDEIQYVAYLGNAAAPSLLSDNRSLLEQKIRTEFPQIDVNKTLTLQQLKDVWSKLPKNQPKIIFAWSEGTLHASQLPLEQAKAVVLLGAISTNIRDVILAQAKTPQETDEIEIFLKQLPNVWDDSGNLPVRFHSEYINDILMIQLHCLQSGIHINRNRSRLNV